MKAELIQDLKEKKVVFGTKVSKKYLKKDLIEKIYLASDAPHISFSEKTEVPIIKLAETKENLKELCKTRFNVSVISILKKN
jgi:ribosomal protein L30E